MSARENRRIAEQDGAEFYETPDWGTLALLRYESFEGDILEPCCGAGAMARVLRTAGEVVIASDLYDRGYGAIKDVFEYTSADNFVTNPPFNIASDILDHALKITRRKVCLLLRTAFLESKRRHARFYESRPPSRVYVFSERLSMYPAGYESKSGGTTSYSWFVWDRDCRNAQTQLHWIAPGLKP